jgi:hypothetical protein
MENKMQQVFYLQHIMNRMGRTDRKGIGVYSSFEKASSTQAIFQEMPGFRDPRGHFSICRCIVGQFYLPGGFDKRQNGVSLDVNPTTLNEIDLQLLYMLYNEDTRGDAAYDDDFVLLGYYATQEDALAAQGALKAESDFVKDNRQFGISVSTVNRDNWTEGF